MNLPENPVQQVEKIQGSFSGRPGKRTRLIYTLLTFLVTGSILGFLIYRQKDVLLTYEWRIQIGPAIFSFVVFSLDLLLVAVIWGWMMNTLGKDLPYLKHIRYYCISNVAKRIPGTIWYIASRAQMYRNDGIDFKLTSLASGMELAITVMSGILVSLFFAIPIILRYQVSPFALVAVFLLGLLLIHPRGIAWIFRLLKVEASGFNYRSILQWLLAYVLVWILGGVVLYSIGNAFIPIPIRELGYFIGSWGLVGILSSVFFFSPSNMGVTEVGLSLLLANIMPSPIAVIVSVVTRILIIIYEIIWAAVCFQFNPQKNTD